VPEICRFYGIVIKMYFADHAPPHFHAEYAEHEVRIAINTMAVITGSLPPRAMDMTRKATFSSYVKRRPDLRIWLRSTSGER